MNHAKNAWEDEQCLPNYDFWRRAAYWTIEEGAALTIDKEPTRFNSETLAGAPKDHPVVAAYFDWLELANRAVQVSRLSAMPSPEEFVEWKRALGSEWHDSVLAVFMGEEDHGNPLSTIDYKASYEGLEKQYRAAIDELRMARDEVWELQEALDAQLQHQSEVKKRVLGRTIDERQHKSLQKLILSIAVGKYRFNPKQAKNSAAKNMESATLECGLGVTDETIRNHLREAVRAFPEILNLFEDE